jgi:nucleotide-binding universal stress UspA family protein
VKVTPKKVLWPTDFSKLSTKVAEYAAELCDALGAKLHLVHVCMPVLGRVPNARCA